MCKDYLYSVQEKMKYLNIHNNVELYIHFFVKPLMAVNLLETDLDQWLNGLVPN